MSTINLSLTDVLAAGGGLLVLFLVWRAGARRARAAADVARGSAGLMSLSGQVLFNAALIVAAQWVVITKSDSHWLLLGVLALPALFSAHTLTRAMTVTAVETTRRGGRR